MNLHLRNKNLNLTLGGGYSDGGYKENVRNQYFFTKISQSDWFNVNTNKTNFKRFVNNFVVDYQINKRSFISISLNQSHIKYTTVQKAQIEFFKKDLIDSTGETNGNDWNNLSTYSGSFNFHSDLKKNGSFIDLSFDYLSKKGETENKSKTNNYVNGKETGFERGIYSYAFSPKEVLSGKIDFVLSNSFLKHKVESGAKVIHFFNNSKIAYDQFVNEQSVFNNTITNDNFNYSETDIAAYVSLGRSYGKFSAKYGMRYEYTITTGHTIQLDQSYKNHFGYFFPSLFLQYKLSKSVAVDFSYVRRISRPKIWDVNPYRWFSSIYSYSVGNPYLVPSLQNSLEANVVIKDKLFINSYYNIRHDPIVSLPYSKFLFIENIKENNGRLISYGLNIDYNIQVGNWMQAGYGMGVGAMNFRTSYQYNYTRSPIIADLTASHSFQFKKDWSIDLVGRATLPGSSFDVTTQNGSLRVDIGVKKMLLAGKLGVSLSVADLFRSSSPVYTTKTLDFFSEQFNYYDFRSVSLSVKFKFGKALREAKTKSGVSSSEKMRI
ncbi:TonB-dependent receptor family protein [Chitinophaga oryzae]|uniref:TonB-dependent receptor family protein n=1 Tax=Chitinophaga oryzae TaxID=2725414 RepID=A0ABX6LH61_9BACT|nr:outer membrane beta-barrel family protein [Chitinophaga oryzae]QJB39469.1 TonB-dependent receptor family protein [Chitinophaga oryzae]